MDEIEKRRLDDALRGGDLDTVENLHRQIPELLECREGDLMRHPLFQAASGGHLEICAFLVGQGMDVNTSANGSVPMLWPALNGNLQLVRWFVEHGSLIDGYPDAVSSPLYGAVKEGHLAVAEYLLTCGADANFLHRRFLETPLDRALGRKQTEMAELLRNFGGESSRRPDRDVYDVPGGGILWHVSRLGRLLPVPVSKESGRDRYLRLAILERGYGKDKYLLFTHGMFAHHRPMVEAVLVLPGGWCRLDPSPQSRFPILFLSALYERIRDGWRMDETTLLSSDDPVFRALPWPDGICGFWPVNNDWQVEKAGKEQIIPEEEVVTLYTLLPVRRTRKPPTLDVQKNRRSKWDKLTLKIAPDAPPIA